MAQEMDRLTVRMLIRLRDDFQATRKRMDNRIGRKADGSKQNIEERDFRPEDERWFESIADASRQQEREIEKMLDIVLDRFPIYTDWLSDVKGVGRIAAGWIIGEFDIEKATTVSKLWQFSGLNSGMVRGKKRIDDGDGKFHLEVTDTMIRGDKLTPGFVAPFNKRLRTALVGVLADGFVKAQSSYALDHYYPYKERLSNETSVIATDDPEKAKPWNEVSKGHRDRAAKRFMIKRFLQDLYVAWRIAEGLVVREPYAEEYLGKRHTA